MASAPPRVPSAPPATTTRGPAASPPNPDSPPGGGGPGAGGGGPGAGGGGGSAGGGGPAAARDGGSAGTARGRRASATGSRATKRSGPAAAGSRRSAPRPVATLAIDIGGTGLKASVLDRSGQMLCDRVRIPTPYPLSPQKLVTVLEDLIKPLPPFDRVSVGFPGMVRGGHILSAPHFISPDGPAGPPVPKLVAAWGRFDLESELARVTGKPKIGRAHV